MFRLGNLKICIWGAFGKYIDSHVPNCTKRKPCEAQLRQEAQVTTVFLQCLGATCAGYAGQAMYFSNVANIFRPGQALYSSNVWVAPLLDMLARLYIPPLCLVYLSLALALYSSNVWVTPVLDMLARPCISPMWLIYLGLAKVCIPQMSGWHLCWMCWGDLASSVKERSKENKGIVWVLRGLCKFCRIASSVKERSKENEGIVWVLRGLCKLCKRKKQRKQMKKFTFA